MPIERLSFDVLGDIFTSVCDAIDSQGAHHTIMRLSSVCSTWHHAALAHPKLWSYIYLPMLSTAESSRPAEAQQSLLSLYIQRSRERPLTITIRNNRFAYDLQHSQQLPFTPEIYALLRANAHRWHCLDIMGCHANPHYIVRLLSSLPCSEMRSLKSLRFVHADSGMGRRAGFLLEWKKATALRTLHVHMYTVFPIQCCPLVKDLILEGCGKDDTPVGGGLSCVLPFFNVERLVLSPGAVAIKNHGIEVANLTSLTLCISIHCLASFGSYIHELFLPRLRSFVIMYRGAYLGNAIDHRSIVLFTHRCASSLQDLIFDKLPLRPLGLAEILAPLRELRHLTVLEPTILLLTAYYPISEAFLLNFYDACFLPSLVTVDLQLRSTSTVERSMIDEIVNERNLRSLDANEAMSLRERVTPHF
ncbi:hypothetical protein IW261DRAFT_1611323 [Armillaria novae-zelandiae]|uniref:F-box domain-containing protein n=1 Tax=Armillaria novae-zelandiae TaxID=153914 RepID=A0AA39NXA0_9AGAR|nr:hypothetical protein IW261DRAFT_1611323 [Armillaria novae-zelandiae]